MEEEITNIRESPTQNVESERDPDRVNVERDPDRVNAFKIPDGGWGWVVCFAGFMTNFTVGALVSSSGIFLLGLTDIYDDAISKVAMVDTIFDAILMSSGPIVLFLLMFNASHRQIIICGGFVSAVSTLTCFFVKKIEILYVTYGIISGCFVGISYFSCNTIVGCYFKKKRALAVGIAQSGTGSGTFVLSYLLEQSISFYGMRGTFLLISGLFLNFLVYGALCRPLKAVSMKKKTKEKTKGITLISVKALHAETNLGFEPDEEIFDNQDGSRRSNSDGTIHQENLETVLPANTPRTFSSKCNSIRNIIFDPVVLKNPGMQLLLFTYLLEGANKMVPVYIPAKTVDVGLTREQGALIMSIYGGVLAVSHFTFGMLADLLHIPTSYILMTSLLVTSAISIAFTFCHSFTFFALCISLFAICKGFIFPLRIVLVASILGVENLEKGYSPLSLLIGVSYIIHTKITGSLLDATQSFNVVFYFIASSIFMAYIMSGGIVYMQRKKKFSE